MFKIKREMEQTLSTQIIRYAPHNCYDFKNRNRITIMLSSEQKYIDGRLFHLCREKNTWSLCTKEFWTEKKNIYLTPINYKKTYETINNIKK